jgi:hypothetical protein
VLADLGTDNRVAFGRFINLLHDIRTGQSFSVVFQREADFQIVDKRAPLPVFFLFQKRVQPF